MSCRCPRERPLNETHRKCRQERLNRAKSVSFSHLTKHRLIKRLQCFLPETQLKPCPHYGALPPKISPKLPLSELEGAAISSHRVYQQAGVGPQNIDLFELHDAYTIIAALSLEAAGFAKPGEGVHFGKEGAIAIDGTLPISTMGGLKARGHPVGATGVYQLVEAYQQLTGTAGANQTKDPQIALVQNIGGTGATVVSHILTREA